MVAAHPVCVLAFWGFRYTRIEQFKTKVWEIIADFLPKTIVLERSSEPNYEAENAFSSVTASQVVVP